MKTSFFYISITIVLFASCTQSNKIEGFDEIAWKEDVNACQNQRASLWSFLSTKKDLLKKLDDNAIADLLGSPERNRQFSKGKKNYIYFLYPGSQCNGDTTKKEGKKLVIEFDAIGNTSIIRESYLDF